MFPKVLIAAPQNEIKNYCWKEWTDRVNNLTYPNYDVFIADNSDTPENINLIKKHGYHTSHVKVNKKGIIHTINDSHNTCRDFALKGGYKYMFHLETDVIPPFDVIERLMQHKTKVCSGLYDIFHGKERKVMAQLNEEYNRNIRAYRTVTYAEHKEPNFYNGTLQKVYHAGIGCCLIHEDVLSKIKFRVEDKIDFHSDTWFANDCYLNNIDIFVDTTIQCKHINSTWLFMAEEVLKNTIYEKT